MPDLVMRLSNDLRAPSPEFAEGEVLEVGFGTGLNLGFYPPGPHILTRMYRGVARRAD